MKYIKQIIKTIKPFKIKMPSNSDAIIHICIFFLMIFGSGMIFSVSVGDTITNELSVVKTIFKQSLFVVIAYFIMVNLSNHFNIKFVMKYSKWIGLFMCLSLGACFMYDGAGGAQSWIYLPIPFIEVSIQPSEFFKVFIILNMACAIERYKRDNTASWLKIIGEPLGFYAIALGLIFLQNDLGSLVVISFICAICLLIPNHKQLQTVQKWSLGGILLVIGFLCITMTDWGLQLVEHIPIFGSHVASRFEMAANPWLDEYNKGAQLIHSLYAFASGGLSGLGPGQSIQKLKYLPAASTDYILAIVVEELGIFGFLIILITYSLIIYRLVFIHAIRSRYQGFKIIYIGTALYIFIHFVFNVGGVTGLIPLTGIPLLFISAGSSSLISICMAIGICQALISKENTVKKP